MANIHKINLSSTPVRTLPLFVLHFSNLTASKIDLFPNFPFGVG